MPCILDFCSDVRPSSSSARSSTTVQQQIHLGAAESSRAENDARDAKSLFAPDTHSTGCWRGTPTAVYQAAFRSLSAGFGSCAPFIRNPHASDISCKREGASPARERMKAWSFVTMLLGSHACRGTAVASGPSLTVGSNGTLPAAVVIMAQGRSGSTMLGELFKSNQVNHAG